MVPTFIQMADRTQFLVGGGDCEKRASRKGEWTVTEMIRLEEEETDQETQEWKKEIKKTRDEIKKIEQSPSTSNQPEKKKKQELN